MATLKAYVTTGTMTKPNTPSNRVNKSDGFMRALLLRILAILGLAIAIGFINILGNSHSPKYGQGLIREGEVELSALPTLGNIQWIDARPRKDYEAGHVRDAISINEDEYYGQIGAVITSDMSKKTLLVYCSFEGCDSSLNVASMLKKDTHLTRIYALHGGWEAISQTSIEIVSKEQENSEALARLAAQKVAAREAAAREAATALLKGDKKAANPDEESGDEER
jgi:rhodanese-related sulfurtransferase